MATSFFLLRLPNEERLQVLRCMDGKTLLLLSLLSRKTKDLVKSVQMKRPLHVTVGNTVTLQLGYVELGFYREPQDNMRTLEKPTKVRIAAYEMIDGPTQFEDMELQNSWEIREWYRHILYILNIRQAAQIKFYQGWQRFDLGAIKSTFGKFDTVAYRFEIRRNDSKDILSTFLLDIEGLELGWNPYPRGDSGFQKMLLQNFDSLYLGSIHHFEKLNLDDLLICNAKYIRLGSDQKFEGINQFLKLWIKGGNPRLRKFTINPTVEPHYNPDEVLKGIKIVNEHPVGEKIVFEGKAFRVFDDETRVVDIRRHDGTSGTVLVRLGRLFDLLVWN